MESGEKFLIVRLKVILAITEEQKDSYAREMKNRGMEGVKGR